ncbi:MAG TPA: SPOR domain-containing protein [Gemmatimonadaceae bacterium]|nr:SPOR domain-containing protein [Gemmatimonadaceae bacterium]
MALRRAHLAVALIFCVATPAAAQSAARAAELVFIRAQELASDGNTVAGRSLIDSIIRTTPPTSPIYPEALFWRATLATSAAAAESDYRHIVVDYPLAPHAEDALLRLAQLELARGDRDDALVHLQRIPRDYPRSKSLARANYWTARVLFEKNDVAGACAANAKALTQTAAGEVELRNQIEYQGQRCASYAAAQRAANEAATVSSTPSSTVTVDTPSVSASSTPAVAATTPIERAPPPRVTAPVTANDTRPSRVEPKTPVPSAAEARAPAVSSRMYSVQVAAYNRKADAEKLAASLEKRGYEARVDGTVSPFRVRIGRYATNAEAQAALREIKSKRMDGFVLRVP